MVYLFAELCESERYSGTTEVRVHVATLRHIFGDARRALNKSYCDVEYHQTSLTQLTRLGLRSRRWDCLPERERARVARNVPLLLIERSSVIIARNVPLLLIERSSVIRAATIKVKVRCRFPFTATGQVMAGFWLPKLEQRFLCLGLVV